MAKYTLEIRDIVESYNVELFDFDYDYYADNYAMKKRFENMFIQHYFFHEIGFESIERFKLNLKARLNMNAPLYKQYWDSYLKTKNIDFTVNKEYYETITKELESENESTSSNINNSTSRNDSDSTSHTQNKSSSLSDGVSMAKLDNEYITGISYDESRSQSTDTLKTENVDSGNTKDNGKQSETITTSGKGNIGTTSSAQLIKEWRQIMLNLDKQIIEECADLFMQIY